MYELTDLSSSLASVSRDSYSEVEILLTARFIPSLIAIEITCFLSFYYVLTIIYITSIPKVCKLYAQK